MSANILFSNSSYNVKDLKAKSNGDGTYDVPIGAMDAHNSAGEFYLKEPLLKLFNQDGYNSFSSKCARGFMTGEANHPIRQGGMTDKEYLHRNLICDKVNTSHIIHKVYFETTDKEEIPGRKVVVIWGTIEPTETTVGKALKADLDNPRVNVGFSFRCFSIPKLVNGKIVRFVTQMLTFDWIDNPGIKYASANKGGMSQLTHENSIVLDEATLYEAKRNGPMTLENSGNAHIIDSLLATIKTVDGAGSWYNNW